MLPHAPQPGRRIELCNTEQQAFALVFENPSGRISVSLNRTAIPAGRDGEGAVKRDLLGFRVVSFLFRFLLVVYRSEEHTSELQSQSNLVCRLLLEKKKDKC